MQSKMEAVSLKFCSPGANEKEKQEGNPLREVTTTHFVDFKLFNFFLKVWRTRNYVKNFLNPLNQGHFFVKNTEDVSGK